VAVHASGASAEDLCGRARGHCRGRDSRRRPVHGDCSPPDLTDDGRIVSLDRQVVVIDAKIDDLRALDAKRVSTKADTFRFTTPAGTTFQDRSEAGEWLRDDLGARRSLVAGQTHRSDRLRDGCSGARRGDHLRQLRTIRRETAHDHDSARLNWQIIVRMV
jgi:hypothetical protein